MDLRAKQKDVATGPNFIGVLSAVQIKGAPYNNRKLQEHPIVISDRIRNA